MARGLSGSSQYLSRADQTELRVAFPMALSLWFKGSAQGNFKYIVSKLLLANEHPSYGFASDSGGDLRFYIGTGTSAGNVSASREIAAATAFNNAWNHFLGTYDGANIRLYVNGTEATPAATATAAIAYANLALYVGSFDGTQLYATGSVAEMALYNAVPTADERAALAAGFSPLLVKPSALVGYWPLIGRYSPEIDVRQGLNLTVTSATTADHTRVFQRTRSLWVPVPDAAGGTNATAEAATLTVAGQDATTRIAPSVEAAAITWSAQDATVTTAVVAPAEAATLTWAGQDATTQVAPTAEAAAVAWAGQDASTSITVNAECATITWAAADATVSTGSAVNAAAECATLTVAAADPQAAVSPSAEAAAVTWSAQDPSLAVKASAEASAVAWAAQDATVAVAVQAIAQAAAATFAAGDPSVSIAIQVEAAIVELLGLDATGRGVIANATSTPTVSARRTGTATIARRRTSTAGVTSRRTSTPDVSDG